MNYNRSITATVYVVNGDAVLLHKHKKYKTWFALGGHVEADELPHEAALREVQPEISGVLVPHCVYRSGCPEMHPCGMWDKFCEWCRSRHGVSVQFVDIQERYALYNEWFYENLKEKKHE